MNFIKLMESGNNQNKALKKLAGRFEKGVGQGSKNYMNDQLARRKKATRPRVMF